MTSRLPSRVLRGDTTLYRIHRADHDPWWFSADGRGRFDPLGTGRGACYFALDGLGAFVEVFRKRSVVAEAEIRQRRLFSVRVGRDMRLVDLLARRGLAVGITASLGANQDYGPSQALAAEAVRSGAQGVRYLVRHDPAQRLIGVALFSTELDPQPFGDDVDIPEALVLRARPLFQYTVVPEP